LQHSTSLPNRQPRPWSLLDKPLEDTLGLGEAVASKQQFFNALPIPAPLLNFVEVAPVGEAGVVGFFGGPVVGHPADRRSNLRLADSLEIIQDLSFRGNLP